MSETIKISIPADNEGYILMQCPICGTFFKIGAGDLQDDRFFQIYCPSCGLSSESYLTEDVIELAINMAENYLMDSIFNEFKKLERRSKKGFVQFKAGNKPKEKPELPIHAGIQAMHIVNFDCCKTTAKIKPLLKMTGCYCPFCGVKDYEVK